MRKFIKYWQLMLLWFCLLLLLLVPVSATAQSGDPVEELMSRMSVEDKVGQLFLVPFVGAEANPGSEVWQLVTEYKVGGIILLAANSNFNNDESAPRQIAELNNTLQTTAFNTNGLPLFIAIDHEGDGFPYTRITRGASPAPSQMAIGATWDTAKAESIGQMVGQELSAMGINMLLGPNLDVLNDPRPTGRGDIGIRVFGGDPYWVGQMGRAYIRGVHAGSGGKMATVAKHFPGHGGSDRLPDNEVATVDKSLQELRRIELPPFFEATRADESDPQGVTDALMSSHIRYRGFQGDIRQFTAPISFDAEGMATLTRLPEIAQWRAAGGLIVSDALGVPAVRRQFDPSLETFPHRRIAKEAFLAGNDVLSLVQFDLKSIWSDQFANIKDTIFFFRTEYLNNPAFAAQVDRAVARILRAKLRLYPSPGLDALNVPPSAALEAVAQPRPVVDAIARQSVTLLYPTLEELRLRLPEPPRPDEQLLIINDTRYARECYLDSCEPKELYIPRNTLQDTILRLYGPGATGQIQPENISTITFAELKQALAGSIVPLSPATPDESAPENPAIQVDAEEVRQRIQAADWLIFSALDLNISRFPNSDALKLFLAQESGTLRDKRTVVVAFNAPYYLDTTEVTKLTAYYGIYSKTTPHIEAAVRALFNESELQGASPVSVEGIGYELVDVLAPDPEENIPLELLSVEPEDGPAPVEVTVLAGPVLDHNGNPVPDDTPVQVSATLNGRAIDTRLGSTQGGVISATLTLDEPGNVEISVASGLAESEDRLRVQVDTPPTATPLPPTTTPTATPPEAAVEDVTTPTPPPVTATPTNQAETAATATPEPPPIVEPSANPQLPAARRLDGLDLLIALAATLLAGIVAFWLGQMLRQTLSRRIRIALWIVVGGLTAYLLYGVGLLRPETWLLDAPGVAAARLSLAALVFVCGLVAFGVNTRIKN
ncbi:MAG: hypothetical protein Kow0031_02950 [Anaerolineae bacterium]